jgi:DNA-binding CsgD family transcriptional regulator
MLSSNDREWLTSPTDEKERQDGPRGETNSGGAPVFARRFPGRDLLTPRELAVLEQFVHGASNKEAGIALGVSSRTIEFHRANIMHKLGVKGISKLLMLVLRGEDEC